MSQFPTNPSGESSGPAGSGPLVLVGAALAFVAVLLMNFYVEMRVAADDEDTVTLFRFTADIEAGKPIKGVGRDLEAFEIPASLAENAFGSDAVRAKSDGSPADGVNYDLNIAVIEGEVLRSSLFIESGRRAGRGNPPKIGEHQIALSVDSEDQPANLAPGDRIDLYGAIRMSRSTEYEVVMEYVEVAAVGERRSESGDGTRTSKYGQITININPKDVPKLFDIQQRLPDQEFRISLRAPNDTSTPITGGEAVINPEVLRRLGLD